MGDGTGVTPSVVAGLDEMKTLRFEVKSKNLIFLGKKVERMRKSRTSTRSEVERMFGGRFRSGR